VSDGDRDDEALGGSGRDAPEPNEALDERAERFCANLLIFTYLPKADWKDVLLDDDLAGRVRHRLGAVGLTLVDTVYSEYFAVRLKPEIESDVTFDWSTNLRLPKGAIALLVVLWAKLVLPKRVAMERRESPDEGNMDLFPERKPRRKVNVSVHRDALFAEFGARFGKVNFQRYLGQLRNRGFVQEDRAGNITEGPLLDLMIDGSDMAMKLKDSVLWELLGGDGEAERQETLPLGRQPYLEQPGLTDDIGFPEDIGPEDVEAEIERLEALADLDPEPPQDPEPEEFDEEMDGLDEIDGPFGDGD
jgi:hypothetical protein